MNDRKDIRITEGKGFQMRFANGNTVSVQFGYGNYCDNRNAENPATLGMDVESNSAEVAAWDSDGKWYSFGTDDVAGYFTANDVGRFIEFVRTSDLQKDRFDEPE